MHKALILTFCGLALAGCDQLGIFGIESPAQIAAAQEAEGRAIGSACRHSGRALEDCFARNKKAAKAAIFSGWRDMDAYMRENNIEIMAPPVAASTDTKKTTGEEHPATTTEKPAEVPAKKAGAGHTAVEQPLPAAASGGKMI
jgi:hypothetical protein